MKNCDRTDAQIARLDMFEELQDALIDLARETLNDVRKMRDEASS